MKTPARRLGRGLGAFLDFDPAGDDGEAFIEDALGGAKASVIQTSTTPADAVLSRAALVAARTPAPVAPPPPAPAAPPPAPRITVPPAPQPADVREPELPFFDDVIVTDISFDDDVPELAPPPPPQRVPVQEPPRAAEPPPPPPPAREPPSQSGFLDEEFVTGIAFPEVDLE